MKYLDFIYKFNNKYCNYNMESESRKRPGYSYECKYLFNAYNRDVVGAKRTYGNACDIWYNYDTTKYTRIPNTLTFVPKKGDVMIWGAWAGNPYGHVAIVDNANLLWFNAFGQNYPLGSNCHFKIFSYIRPKVLGVIRPKTSVV